MKIKAQQTQEVQHITPVLLYNSSCFHNTPTHYTNTNPLLYNMLNNFNLNEQHINIRMLLTKQSAHNLRFLNQFLPHNYQYNTVSVDKSISPNTSLCRSRNKSSPLLSPQKTVLSHKHNILLQYILNQRKINYQKIALWWKTQLNKLKTKKAKVLTNILQQRNHCASIIQRNVRSYLSHKQFKLILASTKYIFFYSLDTSVCTKYFTKTNNKMQLRIINAKTRGKDITLPLQFCKSLNQYYLPITLKGPLKRKISVNFIINDQCIIDPRYDVECNEQGEYYNIVYHSYLYKAPFYKRDKFVKAEEIEGIIEEKYWENMFKLNKYLPLKRKMCSKDSSNSIRSFSSLSGVSIDQYLEDVNYNIRDSIGGQGSKDKLKPILKNADGSRRKACKDNQNNSNCKKVKFQ